LHKIVDDTLIALKETLIKKNHDYAGEDALSNFHRVPKIARLLGIDFSRDYHYPLLMSILKFDRLQNLLSSNKTPNNESITDSIDDAINYLLLMKATLLDEEIIKYKDKDVN